MIFILLTFFIKNYIVMYKSAILHWYLEVWKSTHLQCSKCNIMLVPFYTKVHPKPKSGVLFLNRLVDQVHDFFLHLDRNYDMSLPYSDPIYVYTRKMMVWTCINKRRQQHPTLQVPFHFFNRLFGLASRIENRSRQEASTPDGQFVLDDVWDTILTPSRKNVEKVPLLGFHQLLTIWRYFS